MNITRLTLPFIVIICIWSSANIQWGGNNWKGIIENDAKGYYAYLPAVIIYQDINFTFFDSIEKKYYNPNTYYDYRTAHNNKTINKYFIGTALVTLPFFLTAHCITLIQGQLADGYTALYPISINIAAIIYLLIALIYLRNLLRTYQVNDITIALLLLCITFGTNAFYYTVCEPGMSHIYSFAIITMFIYYVRKFMLTFSAKYMLFCSVLLGIIVLIRPINIIIIAAIPFTAASNTRLKEAATAVFRNKRLLLISIIITIALTSIQLIFYKMQCGSFFVYSYQQEDFNWLHPQVIPFLFSYKKGLFLYTPITLLALVGFVYLYKVKRFEFWALLLFLTGAILVLSSWWNWWYGGSFSSRAMLDYMAFFALLLAFTFKLISSKVIRIITSSLLVLLTLFCQFQTLQYRYNIIHWENMTKENYWHIIFKPPN